MKISLQSIVLLTLLLCIPVLLFSRKRPTVKIKTDKEFPMEIGDSVTISWTTKNTKHLYCKEISEDELPLKGSIKVCPTKNTIYLFIAEKGRKVKRKELRIKVSYPTFETINIPKSITDEETLSINWNLLLAEYVIIEGFDDKFPVSGKIPFKTDKDTTIIISAYNQFGYMTQIKEKIKVKYIERFDAPPRAARNSNVNISWSYKNTDSVKFINQSGALPPSGDIYINIKEHSRFRLEIYRKDGTFELKDFVIAVYDSKIKFFRGDKSFFRGDDISIYWEVEDADSVKLSCSDKVQALKGFVKHQPVDDEVITLTTYLNGVEDQRMFMTYMITRKHISGETDYSKLKRNIRLDYEIFSTDLSEFPDIVKLYVLVVDSAGNYVHGLAPPVISKKESQKHFLGLVETYCGGKSSEIVDFQVEEFVSKESTPRSISMVLDYSGSMLEPINTLEYAAKSFINNKIDHDYLNVIKFDDNVVIQNKLTKDIVKIKSEVNLRSGLDGYGGGTALYAAIGEGIYAIKNTNRVKELIVFTDGYENSSLFVDNAKAISAIQIAELAKENNIKISCISFGDGVNKPLLETLAAYTGGAYFSVHNDKDIIGVWTELPYLNANYYVITFKSKSIDNLNGVKLLYNNNIGQKSTTNKNIYTELPASFDEVGSNTTGYWNSYDTLYNNKTPLTLPQAIGHFSFNGTILLEEYEKNIDKLVNQMKQDSSLDVVIFGHTDMVDSDKYNIDLSTKRCKWTKDFFIKKGISEDRIIIIPLGEKHPVHQKEEFDWQAQENRRIEVFLLR